MTSPDTGRAVAAVAMLLVAGFRAVTVLRRRPRDVEGRFIWDKPTRGYPLVVFVRVLLVLGIGVTVAFGIDAVR